MKFKLWVLVISLLALVSCGTTKKGSKNIASIMAESNVKENYTIVADIYPPFFYMNKSGQVAGQDAEILKKLAKNMGIDFTFKVMNWAEGVDKATKGSVDGIFTFSKNKSRESDFYYPRVNISLDEIGVFASPTFRGEIRNLEDLEGKRIGVRKGHLYPEEFQNYNKCTKVAAKDTYELFEWLIKGKIKLAIVGIKPGRYFLEYQAMTKFREYANMIKQIRVMPIILQVDPLYLAIPKKINRSRELYQRIDNALLKMQNTGELFQLKQKYN